MGWRAAIAAGVIAGLTYTLSPTTLVFLILVIPLWLWAASDLGPKERRWVLGVLSVAIILRLLALVVFFLAADTMHRQFPVLIGDEYLLKWRSTLLLNLATGVRLPPDKYVNVFERYGQSGLMHVMGYWQLWFGRAPYGVHLLNVMMWLVGAVALHRTVRRAFGPLVALGGLVLLLFIPTLFVWSISALKEPVYFFSSALSIAGAWHVLRGRRRQDRIGGAILAVLALAAVESVRAMALAMIGGGLVIGLLGWFASRRAWLFTLAAALAVVLLAGAWERSSTRQKILEGFWLAATMHLGNVSTAGYSYRLLDSKFYVVEQTRDRLPLLTPDQIGRFVTRAAISFVVVPLPWKSASRPALALIPQQLAWYALAILAVFGAVAGWRTEPVLTWLLVGNILVGATVVALVNGNVGTLVRFRDTVVTIIVWLSALGACAVLESAARRWSPKELPHASA